METFSQGALVFLALIAVANYRNGTLVPWVKAKFLNAAAPSPTPSSFDPASGSTTPTQTGVQTGLGGGLGGLLDPVKGVITSVFGDSRPNGRSHTGIDIGAPTGTPIVAARGGVVSYVGASGDYGNRIDLNNGDGVSTLYAHLSRFAVTNGQSVKVGDVIGYVGATGDATGPHLHFELRNNGTPIDPKPYIGWSATPGSVGSAVSA